MYLSVKNFSSSDYLTNCELEKRPCGRAGAKAKWKYKKCICTFDIETTKIEDIKQSVMYLWSFHIEGYGTIIGRTWNEFKVLCMCIANRLNEGERIVIYSHFLGHEFQYLKGIYCFGEDDVFCIGERRVARCTMINKALEFRCSYLLTNQSLDEFMNDMGVVHKKVDIDFDKKRYWYSPLEHKVIEHCANDSIGLCEAVRALMEREGDTLYTIPMTNTGYVRRDIKKNLHDWSFQNRDIFDVNEKLMSLGFKAFRGGDSHVSRYYKDTKIYDIEIYSDDRSSAYLADICEEDFPMGKFYEQKSPSMMDLTQRIVQGYAVVFKIGLYDVTLEEGNTAPYIPIGKALNVVDRKKTVLDGDRVIYCPYLEIAITDIDWNVIAMTYDFDRPQVEEMWYAKKGKLPREIREITAEYYRKKTTLKDIPEKKKEYDTNKRRYNAVFGCMAQSPLNLKYSYNAGKRRFDESEESMYEACLKYRKSAYLSYFWGIYVTAHSRRKLYKAMTLIGFKNIVYWDTDGIVHLNSDEALLHRLNECGERLARKAGIYAEDKNGKVHYGGCFERKNIKGFKCIGTKRYATESEDGCVEITVSGVNKELGSKELVEKGGIDAFARNMVFEKTDSETFVYNDNVYKEYVTYDNIVLKITDNVYSEKREYKLEYSMDIEDVLMKAKTIRKIYNQMNK